MQSLPAFPWDSLATAKETAKQHPDSLIDLSVGSPVDPTPAMVAQALQDASGAPSYPTAWGTPELRDAIVAWFARRRGVTGLLHEQVLPTIGSKELVAHLALWLGLGPGDVVVHPSVAYPTYDIGARVAGAVPVAADDPDDWPDDTRLVWVNSPSNPTGRVLDAVALARIVARAREIGAVVASDECYAELWWESGGAVPSILDERVRGGSMDGLLAVYSLSKQSNLAGYRAAFVAGDEALVGRILAIRRHVGLMLPSPVQRAMTVALHDDKHVDEQRERYRARRATLLPAVQAAGWRAESDAGLYLWASDGRAATEQVDAFAALGILVAPGTFYGDDDHVRIAITASDDAIARAAARLRAH